MSIRRPLGTQSDVEHRVPHGRGDQTHSDERMALGDSVEKTAAE